MEQNWNRYTDPLLAFASLPGVAHVDEVHRLFAPVAYATQFGVRPQPILKTLQPGEEDAFVKNRDQVRAWIAALRSGKTAARLRVQAEIEALLGGTVELRGHARFADGVLAYDVTPILDGVQACMAYGMAVLADDSQQLWRRVQTCTLDGCGRYFMRVGASRQMFCSKNHAQRAQDKKRGRGRGRA